MKCQRKGCVRRAIVEVRVYDENTTNDLVLCGPDAEEAAGQYPDNIKKLRDVK